MAEAQRARPVEYYNPRVLILGVCFFWGVAMGFCLFYFSPPQQMLGSAAPAVPGDEPATPRTQLTAQERRRVDEPALAQVEPAPDTAARRPAFETMVVTPPTPAVTADGGLTGRTAQPLARRNDRPYSAPQPLRPAPRPVLAAPPPIPELMP